MWPQRIHPSLISNVALRVRDLKQSVAFYCEIFGLEPRSSATPAGGICVCSVPSSNAPAVFAINLIQGLPRGVDPVGMDHLSLAVAGAEDLEDIYALALARGAPTTEPRISDGKYQVFVFDPDGYKIELVSAAPPSVEGGNGTSHRQSRVRGPYGSVSANASAARVSAFNVEDSQ